MPDLIKSYCLRLSVDMSRELRHHAIEAGVTMNTLIVAAIRAHLNTQKPTAPRGGQEAAG